MKLNNWPNLSDSLISYFLGRKFEGQSVEFNHAFRLNLSFSIDSASIFTQHLDILRSRKWNQNSCRGKRWRLKKFCRSRLPLAWLCPGLKNEILMLTKTMYSSTTHNLLNVVKGVHRTYKQRLPLYVVLASFETSFNSMRDAMVISNTAHGYSIIPRAALLLSSQYNVWPDYKIFPAKDASKSLLQILSTVTLRIRHGSVVYKNIFFRL